MSGNNVELFLHMQIDILKYCGLWSPENRNITYFIYTCFALGVQYAGQIFFWIHTITVWGDFEATTDSLNIMITHFFICARMTTIVVNKNSILQLLNFMNSDIFSVQFPEHHKIMADEARKLRSLFMKLLMIFHSGVAFFLLIPFLSQPRVFPYLMWMPVDSETSPGFEIGFVFQMYLSVVDGFVFPTIDVFIITLIIFGCTQLDIIKEKLTRILFDYLDCIEGITSSDDEFKGNNPDNVKFCITRQEKGRNSDSASKIKSIPLSLDSLTSTDRQRLMTDNNKLLIECISQHQAVKRFIDLSENLFNIFIFCQMAGSVEIVCMVAFRLSIEAINTIQFVSSFVYLCNVLAQLYFFCWSGNELTTRSEELRDVLYQCPWYDQDPQFKRILLIAMEYMKKPLVYRAGYFITLSRSIFVSILRCSYSYFTVLNQVNEH